jgi:hypothetical protein
MRSKYLEWAKWLMIFAVIITVIGGVFSIILGILPSSTFIGLAQSFAYIANFEIVAFDIAILLIILYLQNKER